MFPFASAGAPCAGTRSAAGAISGSAVSGNRFFSASNALRAEVEVFVNGMPVKIEAGAAAIQACEKAGVMIPRWVTPLSLLCCADSGRLLTRGRAQVLLPRAPRHCRQLSYVPGGGRKVSQTGRIVRVSRHARNED